MAETLILSQFVTRESQLACVGAVDPSLLRRVGDAAEGASAIVDRVKFNSVLFSQIRCVMNQSSFSGCSVSDSNQAQRVHAWCVHSVCVRTVLLCCCWCVGGRRATYLPTRRPGDLLVSMDGYACMLLYTSDT